MVKKEIKPPPSWKAFCLELFLYAILLLAYFALVLHYLGGWFKDLYDNDRRLFAVMALVIMIAQTTLLEVVSGFLSWSVRKKKE
jgi:Kef-type K+ transport system membrane component KefB